MRTYFKTFGKLFRRHLTRLISIILMVLVSVGFSAGVFNSTEKMRDSLSDFYRASSASDFIVRGENVEEKLGDVKAYFHEENVEWGAFFDFEGTSPALDERLTVSLDLPEKEGATRVYFSDFPLDEGQNACKILSALPEEEVGGRIPIAVERGTPQLTSYPLGTEFSATVSMYSFSAEIPFVVAKIVENPLHIAVRDDPSVLSEEGKEDAYIPLSRIFYLPQSGYSVLGQTLSFPTNEVRIFLPSLHEKQLFSSHYQKVLSGEEAYLTSLFEGTEAAVLTLHENFSFESFYQYADKIASIGYLLTAAFLAVTLLVVLSTMTRLLDEERSQLACLSTLGYSPMRILSKYLLFALIGTAIGGAGAYFVAAGLSYVIYINFTWNFSLPPYSPRIAFLFYLIVALLVALATVAATLISGLKRIRAYPAVLLRPRAPKSGKKVFLERIPFLWNRLSFKYKSTLRNVLRYKTRFWMTVIAVLASTALVLAGLAVLDCCLFQDVGTAAMIAVGVIVLVFAAALNATVIYTLTNINVSEREREIATLMVLGYSDREVTWYMYREIYITGGIGTALGLPAGALLCYFVFKVMGFGSLPGIGWYCWLLAPCLSLLFTFLVTLMLRHKILKVNMNDSLKAIE